VWLKKTEMLTILEVIKKTTDFFAAKGVDSARLNAELLIGHALGLKRMAALFAVRASAGQSPSWRRFARLVRRRALREPLQYIVGETEFCGLKLKVDRRALIPRPETEHLIELVMRQFVSPPATVLDLGTGSGAIALALAKAWPEAAVTAVDKSEEALALARENAEACALAGRVKFVSSDWFAGVPAGEKFALMVANPPYLSDAETDAAQPEVKDFEPRMALSAGPDECGGPGAHHRRGAALSGPGRVAGVRDRHRAASGVARAGDPAGLRAGGVTQRSHRPRALSASLCVGWRRAGPDRRPSSFGLDSAAGHR
jgi:release factor glutamine methyltransferase